MRHNFVRCFVSNLSVLWEKSILFDAAPQIGKTLTVILEVHYTAYTCSTTAETSF